MFQKIRRKFEGDVPEPRNAPAGTRQALMAASDPSRPVANMSDQPTIVLDHVSKWYGDLVAGFDLSFHIGPGPTAVVGPQRQRLANRVRHALLSLMGKPVQKIEVHRRHAA